MITSPADAGAIAAGALAPGAPVWDVVAVRYGTRMTTRSECYRDYAASGEPDGPYGMDYFFWVLRGETGTILVDSGFGSEAGPRRGRTMVCEPLDALRLLGLAPDAVDLLVISHMHYDHIGQLGGFPTTKLLVHRRDLDFWTGPGSVGEHAATVELDEVTRVGAAVEAGRARVLDEGEVIAPGIGVIVVGGHSPGQLALVVKTAGDPVLLASDAVHYYEELERDLQFAIYTDLDEMRAGYELLRSLAASTGADLVPGHDPFVTGRYPAVSPELEGVAVRLG